MPLFLRTALLSLAFVALTQTPSSAQTTNPAATPLRGEIRLRVRDASGRPVTAHATVHGPSAGAVVQLEVAADGSLTVPDLGFGSYRIDLAQAGFAPRTISLQVQGSKAVAMDVVMAVAGVSTTVTVIASVGSICL